MSQQATVSKERSHISARAVRPYAMKSVDGYPALTRLGIGLDQAAVAKMMEGQGAQSAVGMDAFQQPVLAATVATPVQFLQNWLPGFVKVMTAARKIDLLVGITTAGNWHDEEVVQGVLENIGTSVPYGDYTNIPEASWGLSFERRTVVRFEEGLRVGNLEEARAAAVRVNSAESKRESAGLALEIQRNLIGFSGYNSGNGRTYGFLNDPGLPAYVNVATGVGGLLWSQKTFLEISADIRTAITALRNNSKDTIDPETTPMTLAVATNAVDRLSVTSDFGFSVRDWMTKSYPNIRVVSAPQLNTANGGVGVFYLYAENVSDTSSDDGRTFIQVVPSKFQLVGVAKKAKGYEEDYSNATAGVMCKRPYAVVRYSGIS